MCTESSRIPCMGYNAWWNNYTVVDNTCNPIYNRKGELFIFTLTSQWQRSTVVPAWKRPVPLACAISYEESCPRILLCCSEEGSGHSWRRSTLSSCQAKYLLPVCSTELDLKRNISTNWPGQLQCHSPDFEPDICQISARKRQTFKPVCSGM